jgi:hypothetical protein
MIRWYGSKNGLHISKKSKFLMVGITMSSSSFNKGTTFAADFVSVAGSTIVKESKRDKEEGREGGSSSAEKETSVEGYVSKEVCNVYI